MMKMTTHRHIKLTENRSIYSRMIPRSKVLFNSHDFQMTHKNLSTGILNCRHCPFMILRANPRHHQNLQPIKLNFFWFWIHPWLNITIECCKKFCNTIYFICILIKSIVISYYDMSINAHFPESIDKVFS